MEDTITIGYWTIRLSDYDLEGLSDLLDQLEKAAAIIEDIIDGDGDIPQPQ